MKDKKETGANTQGVSERATVKLREEGDTTFPLVCPKGLECTGHSYLYDEQVAFTAWASTHEAQTADSITAAVAHS